MEPPPARCRRSGHRWRIVFATSSVIMFVTRHITFKHPNGTREKDKYISNVGASMFYWGGENTEASGQERDEIKCTRGSRNMEQKYMNRNKYSGACVFTKRQTKYWTTIRTVNGEGSDLVKKKSSTDENDENDQSRSRITKNDQNRPSRQVLRNKEKQRRKKKK